MTTITTPVGSFASAGTAAVLMGVLLPSASIGAPWLLLVALAVLVLCVVVLAVTAGDPDPAPTPRLRTLLVVAALSVPVAALTGPTLGMVGVAVVAGACLVLIVVAFREMDADGTSTRAHVSSAVSVAATSLLVLSVGLAGPVLSMVLATLLACVIVGPVLVAALHLPDATPPTHATDDREKADATL